MIAVRKKHDRFIPTNCESLLTSSSIRVVEQPTAVIINSNKILILERFILSDHISNIFNLILCFDTQVCAGISESNSDSSFKGFIALKDTCFLFPIPCNNPVIKQLVIAIFNKDIVFKPDGIFLICCNLRC